MTGAANSISSMERDWPAFDCSGNALQNSQPVGQNGTFQMIRVAAFGGCPLHHPLYALRRRNLATDLAKALGFRRAAFALSSGAAVQLLRFCRGELEIPENVRNLCYADSVHVPQGNQRRVHSIADIVLVEMSTPVEVVFDGFILNNNRLKERFLGPVRERYPHVAGAAVRWRTSLQKRHEEARAEAAEEILAGLPTETEDDLFLRELVAGTRVRETKKDDIVADLDCLRTELPLPLGIILHNFNYMPDGRPISWPADFRANCLAAARELGVPIYDPAPLVAEFGAPAALAGDMRHYSPEFRPIIADEIYRELILPMLSPRAAEPEQAVLATA
jgi:RNAse (barnase) inhibitor barstar